jgi:hypothetical protein
MLTCSAAAAGETAAALTSAAASTPAIGAARQVGWLGILLSSGRVAPPRTP